MPDVSIWRGERERAFAFQEESGEGREKVKRESRFKGESREQRGERRKERESREWRGERGAKCRP